MIVMNLIVDDGDERRRNRNMMFDSNFNQIGVGICKHDKFKSITVIMYANEFIAGKGVKRNPQKATQREIDGGDPLQKDIGYKKDLNTDTAKYNLGPSNRGNYQKEEINYEYSNKDYDDGNDYNLKSNKKTMQKKEFSNEGNYRKKIDVSELGGTGNNKREYRENYYKEEITSNTQKPYDDDNKKFSNYEESNMRKNYNTYNPPLNKNVSSGFNEDDDLPEGVMRIERNEKFVVEKGVKKKITKIVRYMENGEINTELFKTNV
jgi:hypothetical protein